MEPMEYRVVRLDGDYALLRRTDVESEDLTPVARALLPDEIEEGTRLRWEAFVYTILE